DWMIIEEMKQTEHYRMYAEVFGIDVPRIKSQPTDSTQGTHKIPSTPRSTHLTSPAPVPTIDKSDELILQDTSKVSLAKHKSRQEQEARENVALVEKHLAYEEIEKMVEGQEHVIDDSSIPRNDEHNILDTRLEPKSDKESPEVAITDVIVHVNVYDEEEEEDEITNEVYELKRKKKGKNVKESRIIPSPTPIRSPRIHTDLELQGHYGYLFEHLRAKFMPRKSFGTLANHLHDAMTESLPVMVDKHVKEKVKQQVLEHVRNQVLVYVVKGLILERKKTKEDMKKMIAKDILQEYDPQLQQQDIAIWLALQIKFERLQVPQTTCRTPVVRPRAQDDPYDDAHIEGENSLKSYNNDVKYGYIQGDLTKDEVEYLKLFEEEIEDRLKYQRQMRRWESYVNGRPLGLRRND
nr:hypothetical protein [Tanacetum cinerariifolium]